MHEVTADNVLDYLRSSSRLSTELAAQVEPLAWGVSNIVLRITPEAGDDFVIKQSREQLRTRAEWRSRLDRIWREVDVMRIVAPLLQAGVVPRVLFEDRENYLFAMEALDRRHVVWKEALLRGDVDQSLADVLAAYLARIHAATWLDAEIGQRLGDTQAFDELRLDPFYRYVARHDPSMERPIAALIENTAAHPRALVLGDFSPKNILLTPQGVSLVDFETGHFGDPAFDIGFFLSHIALKAIRMGNGSPLLQFAHRFWAQYSEELFDSVAAEDLEARCVRHWGACMLARVDGKSPVDYLAPEQQNRVRVFARRLLHEPAGDLPESLHRLPLSTSR